MAPTSPFFSISFLRHLSTKQTLVLTPPTLKNISRRHHRTRALTAAKLALIDYFHFTRCLPFTLSDQIVSNSPFSLSSFLSLVPFPSDAHPSDFPSFIRRFLSYHPIDEFHFFSESIGLLPTSFIGYGNNSSPFLSDNPDLVKTALMLLRFGFPFKKLGLLHQVFKQEAEELVKRLNSFEELGLTRSCVVGACLAFPWVFKSNVESEARLLFDDLKSILLNCDLNDVEGVFEICRKVRVFCHKCTERIGRVFIEAREEVMRQKLRMRKEDSCMFVLGCVDVLDMELERLEVPVPDVLVNLLDLDEVGTKMIIKMYPHVMGRNMVGNFSGILKALNLDKLFSHKILNMNLHFLMIFSKDVALNSCTDADRMEEDFLDSMKVIKSRQKIEYLDDKLEFLYSVGFGRNKITSKIVSAIKGTRDQLQERFNCLVGFGIEHSNVCKMISATPILLNQSTDNIQKKVNYLCDELGYPLDFLINCPFYLCFDLENRIKPRYEIMNWLKEIGFVKKMISPATILSSDEKRFIIYLYGIHPAAPKQWLETFSWRNCTTSSKR